MDTEVLGYTQLVCGTAKIFYACGDQTPLHQRRPEKHSPRAYTFVEDENASLSESIGVFTCWMVHERGKLGNSC